MTDNRANTPEALHATLRDIAVRAARIGGAVALRSFGSRIDVRLKNDRSEVTEVDEAAQAAIIDAIRRERPDDAFIAEEKLIRLDAGVDDDRVVWVIDPLDGTRNYVRGIPHFACSVGAIIAGVPVAGAIYEPLRDRLYAAAASGELEIDGVVAPRRDATSPRRGLNPKLVVALPSSPSGPVGELSRRWLDRYVCRCFGATALHLAWVAAGELDAALCDNARLWDIAAGCALLAAAGCPVTAFAGAPLFPRDIGAYRGEELPLIAAGPAVWTELLRT